MRQTVAVGVIKSVDKTSKAVRQIDCDGSKRRLVHS